MGITPDYPETGYGYIKFNPHVMEGRAYQVERFVEKPNLEVAKEYLATEEYLWNSGMFVWKVSTIMKKLETLMPETYAHLINIKKTIDTPDEEAVLTTEFFAMPSQSIDYGIMEKADHIYTCLLYTSISFRRYNNTNSLTPTPPGAPGTANPRTQAKT